MTFGLAMGFGYQEMIDTPEAKKERLRRQMDRDFARAKLEHAARKQMLRDALADYDLGDLADDLPELLRCRLRTETGLGLKAGKKDLDHLGNLIGRMAWDESRGD